MKDIEKLIEKQPVDLLHTLKYNYFNALSGKYLSHLDLNNNSSNNNSPNIFPSISAYMKSFCIASYLWE